MCCVFVLSFFMFTFVFLVFFLFSYVVLFECVPLNFNFVFPLSARLYFIGVDVVEFML